MMETWFVVAIVLFFYIGFGYLCGVLTEVAERKNLTAKDKFWFLAFGTPKLFFIIFVALPWLMLNQYFRKKK